MLLNAIIDPEGAQMGQMITALNSPLWKWTVLNIFLQNLAMRLQLLRPHSADQYYFPGLAFFRNFNKNTKLVLVPFLQRLSGLWVPNCLQLMCVRTTLWLSPSSQGSSWEQSILWGKELSLLKPCSVSAIKLEILYKKRAAWFTIFKWVVLNYSKCCITNPAESILISTKNSKDHKLSDWHYMITSKILMIKKHVSL